MPSDRTGRACLLGPAGPAAAHPVEQVVPFRVNAEIPLEPL